MKKLSLVLVAAIALFASCSVCKSLDSNIPKTGTITIPAKSDFTMWKSLEHCSFNVTLTNNNANQSCEVYYVTKNGKEKWINPSLKANTTLEVNIPRDGYMLLKNFNPNEFTITYKIND
jgi:uncharacterized lipoprotein YajG